MSIRVSYRHVTEQDLYDHAEKIRVKLEADEAFSAAVDRARSLGVQTEIMLRHTFTEELRDRYTFNPRADGIPFGYAGELRIDLVRDGKILFAWRHEEIADGDDCASDGTYPNPATDEDAGEASDFASYARLHMSGRSSDDAEDNGEFEDFLDVDTVISDGTPTKEDIPNTPDQLTFSFRIIRTPDTLFGQKLDFLSYEEIDGIDNAAALLEDALDRLEADRGGVTTCLLADSVSPDLPTDEPVVVGSPDDFPEGTDVGEILAGSFGGGENGEKSSLYAAASSLRPLRIWFSARRFGAADGGMTEVGEDDAEAFFGDFRRLPGAVMHASSFYEALITLGLYSLEPSAADQRALDEVTVKNPRAFKRMCEDILRFAEEAVARTGSVTFLW